MITAYSGEFTISPIPTELTLNFCSHKCAYCFANLNNPNREVDIAALISQIKNHGNQNNLTAFFLKEKYPIVFSNKVDPFALSNYRQSLSILELFAHYELPVCFQTKGGSGVDEALDLINPSKWYISISMMDDSVRKKIEPGAPTISSRFALIEKLLSQGHSVSVGVNPLVEEWCPTEEAEELLKTLKGIGVIDLWVEGLHFNHRQVAGMSQKEKDACGADVISRACKKSSRLDEAYLKWFCSEANNFGFNTFSMNQPLHSHYFDSYHKTYPGRTLKTHQDFINKLIDEGIDREIKFSDYYEFMRSNFFEDRFSDCDGYVYSIARNIHKKLPERIRSFREILRTYWNYPEIAKSLAGNTLFRVLRDRDADGDVDLIDEEGNLILWFSKKPSDSWVKYIQKGGE